MQELISRIAAHRTTLLVIAIVSLVWCALFRFWLSGLANETFPIAAPRVGLFINDLAFAYLTSYMFFVMVEYWGKGQERKRLTAFKDYLSNLLLANFKRYTYFLMDPNNVLPTDDQVNQAHLKEHLKWIGIGIKTLHAHPEHARRVLRTREQLNVLLYKLEKLHDVDIQKSGTYFRIQIQRVHDELEEELDGETDHDKAFHANESLWWAGERIKTLTHLTNDFD